MHILDSGFPLDYKDYLQISMKQTQWDCDFTLRTAIANRWHFCGLKVKMY